MAVLRSFFLLALGAALPCPHALAAPETYTVTPGPAQSVRFEASTQTEHYGGHTDRVSGLVRFDPLAPALSSAQFDVALSSLSTGNALRDSNMRRLALQTDTFPAATFRLTRIVLPAALAPAGRAVRALAQGTLTLHGVTRAIAVPIVITREQGALGLPGLHLVSRFPVRLDDYHIRAPRFLFFAVRQEHTLSVDLHAVLAARRERPAPAARNRP